MSKVIAAINVTLDGFCDHTSIIPDEEMHLHYAELLNSAGATVYGRITYQLMEYWRNVLQNPSDIKTMNDFAVAIDKLPKIVFSRTLKKVDWETARLANKNLAQELKELKAQTEKDILVGSRSLIIESLNLGLVDELQLCVHPVAAGKGLLLFDNLTHRLNFKFVKTKVFDFGALVLYYKVENEYRKKRL